MNCVRVSLSDDISEEVRNLPETQKWLHDVETIISKAVEPYVASTAIDYIVFGHQYALTKLEENLNDNA